METSKFIFIDFTSICDLGWKSLSIAVRSLKLKSTISFGLIFMFLSP